MSKQTKPKVAKPTYKTVKGDAFEQFFNSTTNAAIMHGCNCQKMMGAGFADQVRTQLAPMYYLDQFDGRNPSERYGNYTATIVGQVKDFIKIGVNLYTQFNPGANFELAALTMSLKAFTLSVPKDQRATFTCYLPWIGAGIGGGDWKEIEPVIKAELKEFNVVVVEFVTQAVSEKAKK
jgi:O-acetyl-ADP-ribose deacetylase (regulator of RNase III)